MNKILLLYILSSLNAALFFLIVLYSRKLNKIGDFMFFFFYNIKI